MLTFDAVTTYAERHWKQHAERCVETFEKHWKGIELLRFNDEYLETFSVWLPDFKSRHAWRPTENYRFDAVRFAHKVAAIELAYKFGPSDVLVWIDADCVTHSPVDAEWLAGLLGGADFGYLRRAGKYPECGFMLFRRGRCDRLIRELVRLYRTDELFGLKEWHDSWAIEEVRQQVGVTCASLSGDAENTGHPLVNGPLGSRIDHLKGKRKKHGRSFSTDIKKPRGELYWR